MRNGSKYNEAESSADATEVTLLEFDKLASLASNDPEAFERYREKLYQQTIERAPIELQRRLKGIQFKINMAREAAGNPLSSCMKLSEMMHDSFVELKLALANPQKYLHEQNSAHAKKAEVVELFPLSN